jgi:primary-amine oxidase
MHKQCLVKASVAPFPLLLALVLALPPAARAQPGPDPVHPMDALTASEIGTAMRMLRDAGHTTAAARFPTLTLLENTKTDMWAWREGMTFTRRAFAIVMQDGWVFEADLNLTTGTVEAWREVEGVQPRILLEETDVSGLLWADSRWQEAMAARGFDEDDAIFCTPLTPGPVLPPEYAGRRILYSTCFDVSNEELMTFGLPIEGLMGIIDVGNREVLDVIDLGVVPGATDRPSLAYEQSLAYRPAMKPVTIEAPQGSNIRIEGSVINWDNWRFHLRTDQRVGPVVSLVTFDDRGERRPVAYQIAVSEMFVPYMDPAATWSWKAYMDVGEYGFGLLSSTLQRGADCPASAHYLDQVVADDTGNPLVLRDSVCVFERPLGSPLWRHVGDTATESRPAVELVVRMAPVVGNYDYLVDYVFSKAGDIEVRAGAAGIDAVKAVAAHSLAALTAEADTAHGNMIGSGLVGINHDHFISFRIDLDVDGPENSAVFDRVVTERLPATNPRRSLWRVVEEPIATEGALAHVMSDGFLRIVSAGRKNALGYATGYQLYSGHSAMSVLATDDPLQVRADWSSKPVWLTRHAQDELYASGDYPNQNSTVQGLMQWAAGGESIDNEDLVLWYTLGFRHITRAEDWPGMPTLWHSFRLRPFNFFDGSPVLDVVPE